MNLTARGLGAALGLLSAICAQAAGADGSDALRVRFTASLRAALARAAADPAVQRIELAAGRYALDTPLVLDEGFNRRTGAPFEIAAAPGDWQPERRSSRH